MHLGICKGKEVWANMKELQEPWWNSTKFGLIYTLHGRSATEQQNIGIPKRLYPCDEGRSTRFVGRMETSILLARVV